MRIALFHPGAMGSRLAGELLPALEAQADRGDAALLADADSIAALPQVAWRWGPEFDEIAATLDAADLEGEALRSLRAVWTRLDNA